MVRRARELFYCSTSSGVSFKFFLNVNPALNVTTLRAEMVASIPVLGFRPGRSDLSRNLKLPNPDSFTCCPEERMILIYSKNSSTRDLESNLDNPNASLNASAINSLLSAPTIYSLFLVKLRHIW